MLFKKIFINFKSESSIKKLNISDLISKINSYSGRNKQIYAIYLSTKYAYYKRYIDILNNIDTDSIRIKFLEESSPNTDTGYYLILTLDDEPNNLRQANYFDINKWNTETAMTLIPSCRPGVTYTDTVKKTTTAADGGEYMLSKCDTVFLSPSLERIEEIYGDLAISSPFPLSIGYYKNNDAKINYNLQIAWNTSSISNPIVQDMPSFLLNNSDTGNGIYTSYLTKFQDPTQIAKITLLIVISNNLTIIFRDKRPGKTDYEPFPMRPYQKIYILPGNPNQNRQQVLTGNGDIVYFNKRIDHNIQIYFKRTNTSVSDCTLSAMWGYYSNLFTEYSWKGSRNKYKITPLRNVELFDIGAPTYNNIYTLIKNVYEYISGYNNNDVSILIGYRMEVQFLNDIPYILYYADNKSAIFITSTPFIQFKKTSLIGPSIIKVKKLSDKSWEDSVELISKEYNVSDKSMSLINFDFDKEMVLQDLKNNLFFGVYGSNDRISKDIIQFVNPLEGRYQNGNIGWDFVVKGNDYLCFEKIKLNGVQKDVPAFPVPDYKNYYGIRFKYVGDYLNIINNSIYIQAADFKGYYSRSYQIQANQLYSLETLAAGCPSDVIFIILLFIENASIPNIVATQRLDIQNNMSVELIKTQPPYSLAPNTSAIELPTSYLASTIDALNDADFFNFKRKGLNSLLYEENYVPKIIRQDYEYVKDLPVRTMDATFKKDYYSFRIPNFYGNFPLKGLENYVIPYDNFELVFITNNKVVSTIIEKGYYFNIVSTNGDSFLDLNKNTKQSVFNYNNQNTSYDIYITVKFDNTNITQNYSYYNTISATALIANCAGSIPIEIYSNIVSSYEEYGSLCNSSIIDTNRTKNTFINNRINIFRIKVPIINMGNTGAFDLEKLTYGTPNERQLLLTILLEINFFS